jgi:seryl-tRNA synthetase
LNEDQNDLTQQLKEKLSPEARRLMDDIDAIGTALSAGQISRKEAEDEEDALAVRIRRLPERETRTIERIYDLEVNTAKTKAEEVRQSIELFRKGEVTLGLAKEALRAKKGVEPSPDMTVSEALRILEDLRLEAPYISPKELNRLTEVQRAHRDH